MATDNRKDLEPEYEFPDGYEHFAEMAKEAVKQRKELDQRIKNIPNETIKQMSYRLQLNPYELNRSLQAFKNQESRQELEKKKQAIETQLFKDLKRDIKQWDIEPEIAGQILNAADERVHPNKFKGMSKQELNAMKKMTKDVEHSQDYMKALLWNERAKPKNLLSTAAKGIEPGED